MILNWIFKKWDVGHEVDPSGSEGDRWRALVNAIMNGIQKMWGILG